MNRKATVNLIFAGSVSGALLCGAVLGGLFGADLSAKHFQAMLPEMRRELDSIVAKNVALYESNKRLSIKNNALESELARYKRIRR